MTDNETLIDLLEAAKHFPGTPHTSAIWRWCRKGSLARNGERIYLEHRRVGGKLFTSPKWCSEYLARLAMEDVSHFHTPTMSRDPEAKAVVDAWEKSGWNKASASTPERIQQFTKKWDEICMIGEVLQYLPDDVRQQILDLIYARAELLPGRYPKQPAPSPVFETIGEQKRRERVLRRAKLEIATWKRPKAKKS